MSSIPTKVQDLKAGDRFSMLENPSVYGYAVVSIEPAPEDGTFRLLLGGPVEEWMAEQLVDDYENKPVRFPGDHLVYKDPEAD